MNSPRHIDRAENTLRNTGGLFYKDIYSLNVRPILQRPVSSANSTAERTQRATAAFPAVANTDVGSGVKSRPRLDVRFWRILLQKSVETGCEP
jgi:hypothetical protein